MSAIPTIMGPSYDNYGSQRYDPSTQNVYDLSLRLGGDFYYVIGRRFTLITGYEYCRTGMLMQAFSPSLALPDGVVSTDNDVHSLFYQLRLHGVQVGAEFQTNRSLLAPLGAYIRVLVQYSMIFGDKREQKTEYSSFTTDKKIRNLYLNKMETYDITPIVEIGSRTVLANRITLTLGVRSQLPLSVINRFSLTEEDVESPSFGNDTQYIDYNYNLFNRAAQQRLFMHGIFMVRVGVGFLF